MAHVTLFRMKANPGKRDAVLGQFDTWQQTHMPKVKGFVRSTIVCSYDDPDELMAQVVFDTKENYDANSNTPEQGAWFQELRLLLAADPDWFNGRLERDSEEALP